MKHVIITKPSLRKHTVDAITFMDHSVLHALTLLHLSVMAGECSSQSRAQPMK